MKKLDKTLSLPLWGGISALVAIITLVSSLLSDNESNRPKLLYSQKITNGDNNVQIQGSGNSVTK